MTGSSTPSVADPNLPCNRPYTGPVPATVHLHGGEIPAAFDGDPNSWFTPNGLRGSDYHTLGNPGPGRAIYEYPNLQEPGTLWFHDMEGQAVTTSVIRALAPNCVSVLMTSMMQVQVNLKSRADCQTPTVRFARRAARSARS